MPMMSRMFGSFFFRVALEFDIVAREDVAFIGSAVSRAAVSSFVFKLLWRGREHR